MDIPYTFCIGLCLGNFIVYLFEREGNKALERSWFMCFAVIAYVLSR